MPPSARAQAKIPSQPTGSARQNGNGSPGRGRQGARAIRHEVLRKIEEAAGVTVYCNDIVSDLGASESGVRNAVKFLQTTIPQIVTVVRGQAWRWSESAGASAQPLPPAPEVQVKNNPEPAPDSPLLFEEVGRGKDKSLILKGSDGNVYKAERI